MNSPASNVLVLAVLFAAAASPALGQTKTLTEWASARTGDSGARTHAVSGTVKEYEPGLMIVLLGPDDRSHSFDLDANVRVDGIVIEGQGARVVYVRDNRGRERVMVISAALKDAAAAS